MAIPKSPLAVSKAKKTLPLTIDWGEGIPKDRLRYINAREEALIKTNRSTTAVRSHAGVRAYPDPKDTKAGDPTGGKGADGPSGAGRGSSSGGSTTTSKTSTSSSSSASSSTGGGSKSSPSSTPTSSPSKAPNAAAQAASDKLNSKATPTRSTTNASMASIGTSKAPNAAAAAASDRMKASEAAARASAAAKASSVQSMINNQSHPPTQSAAGAEKMVKDSWFGGQLGSMYKDPAIAKNLPNALKEGMWNQRISDATRVAQGQAPVGAFGERQFAPDPGSGFRTKEQAAENVRNNTGKAHSFHNFGLAADVFPSNFPGYGTPGYSKWEHGFVNANADLAKNIPDSYGIKWGGDFGDPAHFQSGRGAIGTSAQAAATAARNGSVVSQEGVRPGGHVGSTMAYGNDALPATTGFAATTPTNPKASLGGHGLSAAMKALDPPTPPMGQIPTPMGTSFPSMQNYPPTPHVGPPMPSSGVTSAPLGNIPQAPMPNARPPSQNMQMPPSQNMRMPPTASPNNPFGAMGPVGAARQQSLAARMGVDDAMAANPATPVPTARPPSQNMQPPTGLTATPALPGFTPPGLPGNFRGTAGQAYSPPSGPSTYSPQAGPGDQITGENPSQGSSNPMQEGLSVENPGDIKAREYKYASRGSTIGGVIAGPIGSVVGGIIGYQMGKTNPAQRQAIASNPKALAANAQSINKMVEERGGKGNPDMTVRPEALKDVLTNPGAVQANPAQYTSLEKMLAALAQGIDPETGKPV